MPAPAPASGGADRRLPASWLCTLRAFFSARAASMPRLPPARFSGAAALDSAAAWEAGRFSWSSSIRSFANLACSCLRLNNSAFDTSMLETLSDGMFRRAAVKEALLPPWSSSSTSGVSSSSNSLSESSSLGGGPRARLPMPVFLRLSAAGGASRVGAGPSFAPASVADPAPTSVPALAPAPCSPPAATRAARAGGAGWCGGGGWRPGSPAACHPPDGETLAAGRGKVLPSCAAAPGVACCPKRAAAVLRSCCATSVGAGAPVTLGVAPCPGVPAGRKLTESDVQWLGTVPTTPGDGVCGRMADAGVPPSGVDVPQPCGTRLLNEKAVDGGATP